LRVDVGKEEERERERDREKEKAKNVAELGDVR